MKTPNKTVPINSMWGQGGAVFVMENSADIEEVKEKRWCILSHPDSDLIGEMFSGKRKVYNASEHDTYPLPPFEYFIPFEDLKKRPVESKTDVDDEYKSYDAMVDERALRFDLHRFIFICEPKEVVSRILYAPWNRVLSQSLYAYRDENGIPVEISDAEMERFKTVIKRYDFQILNGQAIDEVHEGDPVTVVSGPMAGSEGKVMGICEKSGQVTLTIEFSMFQDKLRIAVPGISIADVRLLNNDVQKLLQDPVISHFEDELIELLCHLHGKKGSKKLNREDRRRLKFLAQYSDIKFEDSQDDQAKFDALMLICSYLLDDKKTVRKRAKNVEQLLQGHTEPESELDCYLMTALFITNHQVELRKKCKTWRQEHPDCLLSIRRFISIAKQIRC